MTMNISASQNHLLILVFNHIVSLYDKQIYDVTHYTF